MSFSSCFALCAGEPLPGALSATSVTIPSSLTHGRAISFHDCAEKVVLRFVQIALLDTQHRWTGGLPRASSARAIELHAVDGLVLYICRWPIAYPSASYADFDKRGARADWAMLLSGRAGLAYNQGGRYELLPGACNFLAALHALFPTMPRAAGSTTRDAFSAAASFFSTPTLNLSWSRVSFGPQTITLRSAREPIDKWTVVCEKATAPHLRAQDCRDRATLCINGKPHVHINWYLRVFLAEPARALGARHSGHAQMFNVTRNNTSAQGQVDRDYATAFNAATPLVDGEPDEYELSPEQHAVHRFRRQRRGSAARAALLPQVLCSIAHEHALSSRSALGSSCNACGDEIRQREGVQCPQCDFNLCLACHEITTSH